MSVSDPSCSSVHVSLDNCRVVLIEISFNEARGPIDTIRSVKMWFAELPIRFKKTLSVSDHQVRHRNHLRVYKDRVRGMRGEVYRLRMAGMNVSCTGCTYVGLVT